MPDVSREYIEEAWARAKKELPGWSYAVIHQQAKAAAGGRSAHRVNEPSTLEKVALGALTRATLSTMDDSEVVGIWDRICEWFKYAVKRNSDEGSDLLAKVSKVVRAHLVGKNHKFKPSALLASLESFEKSDRVRKALASLCPPGPVGAPVAFVGTDLDPSSTSEGRMITGEARDVFIKKYLEPLGLTESDVFVCPIIPDVATAEIPAPELLTKWAPWVEKELDEAKPGIIIALGKVAKAALLGRADFVLPHPRALVRHHDSGEVGRKMKRISKQLDDLGNIDKAGISVENTIEPPGPMNGSREKHPLADANSGERQIEKLGMETRIVKSESLKQIVYGVVMDPYGPDGAKPDAHKDFLPPSTIEQTAHDFFQGDRTIGRQHESKSTSVAVESSIEQYPTPDDYQKALKGEPHKVTRRQYGDDVVHSGSWILGVKLSDKDWAAFQAGEFNAFSPGGFGYRTPITPQEMPEVEFVDLIEQVAT